jgi:urease alpha subunit
MEICDTETAQLVTNKPLIVRAVIKPVGFINLDLERFRLIRSLTMSNRRCTTLLLVGGKASSTTTVATTITTSSREAASTLEAASATAESTATTTTAHAGNIGALWGNLDAAALEHALVKNEGLRDQAGFSELDVGVAFRLSSELVKKNSDSVNGATALEVSLDILRGGGVIDIADKNAARID